MLFGAILSHQAHFIVGAFIQRNYQFTVKLGAILQVDNYQRSNNGFLRMKVFQTELHNAQKRRYVMCGLG